MSTHPVARSDFGRSRARRLSCRTAVSAVALALGLTACATPQQSAQQGAAVDKGAMLLKIADETSAAGDPATAASLYRELHTVKPQDPVPLARLAAASMAAEDYRGAVAAYRAALALDGKNEDYRRGIALALLAMGDAQGAMTEIRAALEQRGDDPRLYNAMGVAQDVTGRHDLAQEAYRHGIELAPNDPGLQNNYAMSEALAGDYQGAVKSLTRIAGPDAPARFQLNLALAYGLAGDDAHAAAVARGVLDDASVENNLAYYALLRGMDEAHRSAAIIATELHGAAPQVATATHAPGAARAAAAPLPAAPSPVVAAVLPAPIAAPQEEAKADLPLLPIGPADAPRTDATYAMKAPPPAPAAVAPKTASAAAPAKAAAPQPAAAAATTATQTPAPVPSPQSAAPQAAPQPSLAAAAPALAAPAASAPAPQAPDDAAQGAITMPIAAPLDFSFLPTRAAPIAWPSDPASIVASLAPAPTSAATPAPVAAQIAPAHAEAECFTVQLGSFEYKETAQRVADYFAEKGVVVATSHSNSPDGRDWIVVRSGEFDSAADAADALAMIRSMGLVEPILIRHYVAPTA